MSQCQLPYALSQAEIDVLDERRGQRTREGYDAAHDDGHLRFELSHAAAAYLVKAIDFGRFPYMTAKKLREIPVCWPWSDYWWKPGSVRRMLVKAAALILAEIERLDRAAAKKGGAQ